MTGDETGALPPPGSSPSVGQHGLLGTSLLDLHGVPRDRGERSGAAAVGHGVPDMDIALSED